MLSFSFRLAETWKTNRSRLNIMDLMGILQFLFIYLQMTSPSWPPSQWGVAAACHPAWCSRTSSWRSSGPLVGHSPGSGPSCPSPCFQTENIFILQQFSKHWITSRVWSSTSHLYPARIFIRVDFPAPEGPIMPISSLLLNLPDRHLRRAL